MRREHDSAHRAVIDAARQRGIDEMARTIAVRDAAKYGPVRSRPADDDEVPFSLDDAE